MDAPKWLKDRELSFKRTGKLNLSLANVHDLSVIGKRKTMKELNISNCCLETINGLYTQPNLKTFIADNSELSSLINFNAIKSVTNLSMKNTPVSKMNNYFLALCIIFGEKLNVIDGKKVSQSIKSKANEYPPYVGELLCKGWELVYPPPSDDEFITICEEYGIQFEPTQETEEPSQPIESSDFQTDIENYLNRHREMCDKMQANFDTLKSHFTLPYDLTFEGRLRLLLETHGYAFDNDLPMEQQLEKTVLDLVS